MSSDRRSVLREGCETLVRTGSSSPLEVEVTSIMGLQLYWCCPRRFSAWVANVGIAAGRHSFDVELIVNHCHSNGDLWPQFWLVKQVSYYVGCLIRNPFFNVATKFGTILETHYFLYQYIHLSAQPEKYLPVPRALWHHTKQWWCFRLTSADDYFLLLGCRSALLYLLAAATRVNIPIQVAHIFLRK